MTDGGRGRMLGDLVIRTESQGDVAAIRRVVAAAFGSDHEADLVEAIRASPEYVSDLTLVAVLGGRVVGHVMVSGARLRHRDGERRVALLAPLAVDPRMQRVGIGAALVRSAAAAAAAAGEPFLLLEGSPQYYGRLGFVPAARYGITMPLPDWAPPEAAQILPLADIDPDDETLRGVVVYPAHFDALSDG